MSATTKKLEYGNPPPRASSARSIRSEVVASNGSTFNAGNTIVFDIGANQMNTYADFQSTYLRLNITNNDATDITMEGAGFGALVKKFEVLIGGSTVCSIDSYNVLFSMLLDMDTSEAFKNNAGKRLFMTSSSGFGGEDIAAGASRQVCFPLALTPLAMCQKYIPLWGREQIRIRIELESAAAGVIANTTGIANSELSFTEPTLVMYMLELGQDVQNQVVAASGGDFKIMMPNFVHHQTTLAAGATSVSTTLGFSMSSLNRVLVAQRLQAVSDVTATIGNRANLGLNRASVKVGGVQYPQQRVRDSVTLNGAGTDVSQVDGAEPLAEALISQRALLSWGHDSSLEGGAGFNAVEPAGTSDATVGKYLQEIDLESQRVDSGELVAGLNVIGQICQYESTYAVGPDAAYLLDIYGEHSIMLVLSVQSGTFQIAV